MRRSKVVELSDGVAVIQELTVRQLREYLIDFSPGGQFATIPLFELANTHFAEVIARCQGFLQLPENVTVDDLSLSEVTTIYKAFTELHQDFFDLMKLKELTSAKP